MNPRGSATSVALVLLAVVTAAYAYFVDRDRISDADRDLRSSDVLPSFRVDEVSRVALEQDGIRLVLERTGKGARESGWMMRSPRTEPADGASVDALLRELELAKRLRRVDDGAAMRLDAPRVRGSIAVGPIEYSFALGADAPRPEGAAYMRLEEATANAWHRRGTSDGAFVVDRSLKVQLLRGADAYRVRALVPYGVSEIERVEVRSTPGRTGFAMERHGSTFRMLGGGLRVARDVVERVFTALADARAETFVDDALADAATSTPAYVVTVVPRDPTRARIELRVGAPCPGSTGDVVVARGATRTSACAARTLSLALDGALAQPIDCSLLFARADEVSEVRLAPVGRPLGAPPGAVPRTLDLARVGNSWHERAPENRELDAAEGESADVLVKALTDGRALDARPAYAADRFEVNARATVTRAGGDREVLDVGAPGPDGIALIHREEDGAILRVDRTVARRFEPHPVALRHRAVWAQPFDAASVVALDDTCSPIGQRIELSGRGWQMRTPPGFATDAASVSDLANAIAHAAAEAWIAEADDGTFGFAGPDGCTLTLGIDGAHPGAPPRLISLVFGSQEEHGVYARASEDAAVFLVSPVLRAMASRPLVDRSRFRIDPASVMQVTLVRGGEIIALAPSGEHLERVPVPGGIVEDADGAGAKVGHAGGSVAGADGPRWEAALEELYPATALHTGPPARDEGVHTPTLEIELTTRLEGGAPMATRITIGAPTRVDSVDSYFARVSGVDATFVVPQKAVAAIADGW
jgi:hypothetical protein